MLTDKDNCQKPSRWTIWVIWLSEIRELFSKLIGFELYFQDLGFATAFYRDVLGLNLTEEKAGHHAQFGNGVPFLCLEKTGSENYPSRDKAVLFLEVDDLAATVASLGADRIIRHEPADLTAGRRGWAVLHDPEGHNVLLLEAE